jgi:DNA-binding NarL/FixJ family response regulator
LAKAPIRIVVVDDFEPWRQFLSLTLQKQPRYQIICEVSDGLQAVRKARELRPDLILLDIGLPSLNGIEAARRIRELSPKSKILFVSENRSRELVKEALGWGHGYLVKSNAARELLPAVEAVLQGKGFLGAGVTGHGPTDPPNGHADHPHVQKVVAAPDRLRNVIANRHEAVFYSDNGCLLDDLTRFVGAALSAGDSAIVIATESNRDNLCSRLYGDVDIDAAVDEGRYIALDVAETLSTLMLNGMSHPVRLFRLLSDLIVTASKAARCGSRVALFGECAQLLWAQGNAEAAIQVEKLGNQLAKVYDVDIVCGYSLGSFQGGIGSYVFEKICVEHSAFRSL